MQELGIDISAHESKTLARTGSEDEQLAVYRAVRDAIRERIEHELIS